MRTISAIGRISVLAILITLFLVTSCVAAQGTPSTSSSPDLTAIVTGLASGIVGSALTQSVSVWLAWRKDRGSARHLAARLAIILEGYALTCAEDITQWNLYVSSDNHMGRDLMKIPDIPQYPEGDGWQALKSGLLERALTVENEIVVSRRAVASFAEFSNFDDTDMLLAGHVGFVGYKAWCIAADMRKAYRLDAFDPTKTSWDILPRLKELHDRILAEQYALKAGEAVPVRSYTFPTSG